jgi:hypothetical protein
VKADDKNQGVSSGHCIPPYIRTASLSEFPIEYCVIEVDNDRHLVHTHGLSGQTFSAKSHLPEGALTVGHDCDREVEIPLPQAI